MTPLDEKIKKIPQSSWDSSTKYLVLIGYYDYDVSWVTQLELPHVIYFKDMPDKAPYTARNKAKGETNILKFIIDFYDSLPQNLINVHQYDEKWYHKGNLVNILNKEYKLDKLYAQSKTPGFVSINNRPIAILQKIDDEMRNMERSGFWDANMKSYFGSFTQCGNFTEGKSGCSQFIVSRERIRSLPKKFYKDMYDWMVNNIVDEPSSRFNPKNLRRIKTPGFTNPLSNHCTSRYLEWTWELIFTSFKMRELPNLLKTYKLQYKLEKSIVILYGHTGYLRDVTQVFMEKWFPSNVKKQADKTILVSPTCNLLKELFADHIYGSIKHFYIIYDNQIYHMHEKSGPLTIEL